MRQPVAQVRIVTVDTDANGVYLVDRLPAGLTSVSYDVRDLGPGLVPGSDLDDGDARLTTVTLAADEDKRDVDFAVIGDATLRGALSDVRTRIRVRPGDDIPEF